MKIHKSLPYIDVGALYHVRCAVQGWAIPQSAIRNWKVIITLTGIWKQNY